MQREDHLALQRREEEGRQCGMRGGGVVVCVDGGGAVGPAMAGVGG